MTPAQHQPQHAPELRAAARHLGRRRFLTLTGAAAALAFSVNLPAAGTASAAELDAARITADPFTLGVASGDPQPGSVLLWTRLAPAPYQADAGLPAQRVTVSWELALDERFRRVVRRGTATAHPEFQHTVHVEADHLPPGHVFYYRFKAGRWISPTGRTRTAPPEGARVKDLTFGLVSCQRLEPAYQRVAVHRTSASHQEDAALAWPARPVPPPPAGSA
ncbi:Alkaline phosphatase OS=Streptomyces fumanus OX=67302 GN=GCM10018772_00980 PE=4 SV=1 [Streptomyces fumanus]